MLTTIKKLFRRKETATAEENIDTKPSLFTRWQYRFAAELTKREQHWSTGKKRVILIAYCLCAGALFTFLLLKPFISKHRTSALRIEKIQAPTIEPAQPPIQKHHKTDTFTIKQP